MRRFLSRHESPRAATRKAGSLEKAAGARSDVPRTYVLEACASRIEMSKSRAGIATSLAAPACGLRPWRAPVSDNRLNEQPHSPG